ncbi:MAG: LPS-assembly protein LptD [Synergistales bacterium]|nr:LPS-assembly protein LptD [Synergistales bacterium]
MVERRLILLAVALSLFVLGTPVWASETEMATLDAEELVFDESKGIATAEGGASLKYQGIRMYADTLEMDTNTNKVRASSLGTKGVTIISGGKVLKGRSAEFDISSNEGVLYETGVALPLEDSESLVYLKGDKVEVATVASARKKGWLPKKSGAVSEDATIGRWEGVSVTTCPLSHPHYRLKAKRLVLIPDQRVVVQSPQVYIGDHLLFTYPFNYPVDLQAHSKSGASFMPKLGYDSDKGAGIGLSGPFLWDKGGLNLTVMGWSKKGLEWRGRIEQELEPWLRIYGETAWEYDSTSDEKSYRPSWGFVAESEGWGLFGRWTQREVVKEELRAGTTYKTTLWRMPEIELSSPWWQLSHGAPREYFRFKTVWGRYEETGKGLPEIERLGLGGEIYGKIDSPVSTWEPFWRVSYMDFRYDVSAGEDRQKITNAAIGAVYRSPSGFEAGTAYVRRWISGGSPFVLVKTDKSDAWDDYDEEELIYQKFGFSLSAKFHLELRGAYSLKNSTLDEMAYKLTYKNNCCYSWVLTYRDDRHEGDSWASLSFNLTAFPENVVKFGDNELEDPFEEPKGLPGR